MAELNPYFQLGDLISFLESYPDQDKLVPIGLGRPHSYRGFYEDLAFEPEADVSVKFMLDVATFSLGREFQGYKGDWFKMGPHTNCWIAYTGSGGGEKIGQLLMHYMLGTIYELEVYESSKEFPWTLDTLADSKTGRVY